MIKNSKSAGANAQRDFTIVATLPSQHCRGIGGSKRENEKRHRKWRRTGVKTHCEL